MTATPAKYLPRFYSEVVKEPGSPEDCAICAGLQLYDAATLGEGVTRDDGTLMNTIVLRELRDEAGLPPHGGLRLDQVAKYLRFVSTRAGLLPPFELDYYPGHGGDLRLTWGLFQAGIRHGGVGILLGNPIGVKDANSPLRTAQNADDYDHAIALMDGGDDKARVFNALRWKQPGYDGEWVSWDDLRQFTEARKDGKRLFGTPDAIACAAADVGSETQAARVARSNVAAVGRITALRDQAKRDLTAATAKIAEQDRRIAELEAMGPGDCTGRVNDERSRVLGLVSSGVDELVARLR